MTTKTLSQLLCYPFHGDMRSTHHPIQRVTQDSREVTANTLFFAVRGTTFDGHQYLPEVLGHPSAFAVVEDPKWTDHFSGRAFWVNDTREAFAMTASCWFDHPSKNLSLVGITGTNGKTTTTFLLKQLWEKEGAKVGIIGTTGTWIGEERIESPLTTPDAFSLQRFFWQMKQRSVSHAAMEVSSIALDQKRTFGLAFESVLFTNLTQDHLDYHGNMETYFQAKLKLFEAYSYQKAVVYSDSPWTERLMQKIEPSKLVTFGENENATFRILSKTADRNGLNASVEVLGKKISFHLNLYGDHNLLNFLGAVACLPQSQWLSALKKGGEIRGALGRLESIPSGRRTPLIFIDYAHTPDALEKVLQSLQKLKLEIKARHLICLVGCGGNRDKGKRPLMGKIACQYSDRVIFTSDNPREEDPEKILNDIVENLSTSQPFETVVSRREAIQKAVEMADASDIVLIAGKGHETYQILGTTKVPFNDKEIAEEMIAQKNR